MAELAGHVVCHNEVGVLGNEFPPGVAKHILRLGGIGHDQRIALGPAANVAAMSGLGTKVTVKSSPSCLIF